jgi:DUF4097 and DUF4098 domain-containing protein YvlB
MCGEGLQRRRINMKTAIALSFSILLMVMFGSAVAQEETVDKVTVELTDPSKPVFLSVGLVNGGITVEAYDGNQVIVEAKTHMKKVSTSSSKKANGMTRIPVHSSSLSIEEYKNKIEISTESWAIPVDLTIMVPRQTSLKLSCVNAGDIRVENVTGEIEASNTNGAISLLNISGSAVANTLNDDLKVTFIEVDPDKDMSFSSFNGDVDVTFPSSLKAKVKLKTMQGEVFTDFEITLTEGPESVVRKNRRDSGGKYEINIDRAFWGTINGGGQTIQCSNFNGDIYIRSRD